MRTSFPFSSCKTLGKASKKTSRLIVSEIVIKEEFWELFKGYFCLGSICRTSAEKEAGLLELLEENDAFALVAASQHDQDRSGNQRFAERHLENRKLNFFVGKSDIFLIFNFLNMFFQCRKIVKLANYRLN